MTDRKPVVAGRFYPDNKEELNAELEQYFRKGQQSKNFIRVRALIAPHAGYLFSGEIAASSYNQIPKAVTFKHVFVIASSHCAHYRGASIYNIGNYLIPSGKVEVDRTLADKLIATSDVFHFYSEAHRNEHSLEVQLPFLYHKLGSSFLLVPIVIGTNNLDELLQIAKALKPYFTPENLFVISTDFSHYPAYDDAKRIDSITSDTILKNDPGLFYQTIEDNKHKGINNLATSICGWTSVMVLLHLTTGNENLKYHHIAYQNSGDSNVFPDKKRVVGYHAIAVEEITEEGFNLQEKDKELLLKIAHERLKKYLKGEPYQSPAIPDVLKADTGAFVSIYVLDRLRGCMGRFQSEMELYKLVEDLVISSANDYRFERVKEDELPYITIEISVLTPLKRIYNIDEFELGRHGIYIRQGKNTGTFLPQVAEKTNWTKEEFISHCSNDKAHIGRDGWKTAELFTYEAIVFKGKGN